MKKILSIIACAVLLLSSCQKWEEYNTNPFGVTNELLKIDFNNVGAYFSKVQLGIYNNTCEWAWEMQTAQNLTADVWSGYMMHPSLFLGGVTPSCYAPVISWCGGMWDLTYRDVMTTIFTSIEPNKQDSPQFYAVAQILRALAMLRVTDCYGPIIYSHYGESATGAAFDTQEQAYNHLFKELDESIKVLNEFIDEYPGAKPFERFDMINGGDFKRWVQFANSIKLRAAIHLAKIAPSTAKTKAEEAVKGGVLESGQFQVSGKGWFHPIYMLAIGYDHDIAMNAEMESMLVGYSDPRLAKMFSPATDYTLFPLEEGAVYKGVRMGITIKSKNDRYGYSLPTIANEDPGVFITAAEMWFCRAEGALRGWDMGDNAEHLYHKGIKTSFTQYGVSGGYDSYIQCEKFPTGYEDTFLHKQAGLSEAEMTINDIPEDSPYINRVCPKWNNSDSKEVKLQKIITQKWIAMYPDGIEGWTEVRRTGYPVMFPIVDNQSQGVLKNTDVVRRMPFPSSLQDSGQLPSATAALGGADNMATRLWWDVDAPNF